MSLELLIGNYFVRIEVDHLGHRSVCGLALKRVHTKYLIFKIDVHNTVNCL
jgi:hypothetical protein